MIVKGPCIKALLVYNFFMMKVDVIIPTYKPTEHLISLFHYISKQTLQPGKVIVINTEEEYWNRFFEPYDILAKYPFVELHHISKEEFDHGSTRSFGVSFSDADLFLMMTDDAVPKDEFLIEKLAGNFSNPQVGIAYARQIPHEGCHVIEKYTRIFNYPPQSRIKGQKDIETLGIKAFFASNVCSMYRREIFDKLGGFIDRTIFNEDMIYARKMINDGYLIAYEAEAVVKHSHNYSGLMQFKRNFDLGVSHADNPETFGDVRSEGEGIKLVKETAKFLCSKFMPWLVIKLVYHSGCKYIGYRLGKKYKSLPKKIVYLCTMNKQYFTK